MPSGWCSPTYCSSSWGYRTCCGDASCCGQSRAFIRPVMPTTSGRRPGFNARGPALVRGRSRIRISHSGGVVQVVAEPRVVRFFGGITLRAMGRVVFGGREIRAGLFYGWPTDRRVAQVANDEFPSCIRSGRGVVGRYGNSCGMASAHRGPKALRPSMACQRGSRHWLQCSHGWSGRSGARDAFRRWPRFPTSPRTIWRPRWSQKHHPCCWTFAVLHSSRLLGRSTSQSKQN